MDKPAILVFGLGFLQKSLIEQCRNLGLFTVGVDITSEALCKDNVDIFEIAAGDDFETTLAIAKKYNISGVVTAATDKPLVMMARVAKALNLPFYSVQAAEWSTDKLLMKQRFQEYGIPCANGMEVDSINALDKIEWNYPVIVKPRDNSGSRGVMFCNNREDVTKALFEAFEFTRKGTILVEEFIDGQEYSIESLHYRGKTYVVQFTQKITTEFPYNVELGHIQPAGITEETKKEVRFLISKIAEALEFNNCASHTELKISKHGIVVIETSPRLGGDFITSMLTPLSTGVNMEEILVRLSLGEDINEDDFLPTFDKSSGVIFFELPEGMIVSISDLQKLQEIKGCVNYKFNKKIGEKVEKIRNSIDRYGYALFCTNSRKDTEISMKYAEETLKTCVRIRQ